MPIWEPLLIYAFGTLWYGVFNWLWFWLWREQPLRGRSACFTGNWLTIVKPNTVC